MPKGLFAILLFSATTAFSAPQLQTELQPDDVWLRVTALQSDISNESFDPQGRKTDSYSITSSTKNVSAVIGLDNSTSATPILGVQYLKDKSGNYKAERFIASAGLKKKSTSGQNAAIFLRYEHNPEDNQIDYYSIQGALQTTRGSSNFYNEVSVGINLPVNTSNLKGYKTISLLNNLKISSQHAIDYIVRSYISISDDPSYEVSLGPSYGLGGEAAFNISPLHSFSISVHRTYSSSTTSVAFVGNYEEEYESTNLAMSFLARF